MMYLSLFKMRVLQGLQYRSAALAGILTQFFWGFMYIMIYEAFYKSTNAPQPISLEQLITFVWLQQSFLVLIMLWLRNNDIINLITKGDIAYELSRPYNLYYMWYARILAQRLSGALLRFLPILLVASLLPKPYRFSLPDDFLTFVLFLITLILGLLIIVALSMLIYISMFYTLSGVGSLLIFGVIGEFLSGLIIPVPLMPDTLKQIVYFLPFRYSSDLPFRIYAGNIGIKEAITSIFIQIFWIIFLLIIGKSWMKKALKRVVVQGG